MDIIRLLQECEREDPHNASGKNEPDSIYGLAVKEIRDLRKLVADFVSATESNDHARMVAARVKAAELAAKR